MQSKLKVALLALVSGGAVAAFSAFATAPAPTAPPTIAATAAPVEAVKKASNSTADHSKFKELQKNFKSGPEVTKACLTCHTEAAKQIQKTKHWTFEFINPETQQKLGKKHIINNFCTSVESNQKFCNACHVGYGWENDKFDFTAEDKVDCVVCHESTGTYRKMPGLSGHPTYKDMEFPAHSGKIVKAPDLTKVAQSVGKTSRANCGACHFYGGGGDAVKHGDLDSSLKDPARYLDIHMEKKGLNFSCGSCHMTSAHQVAGSRYAPTVVPGSKELLTPHMRGKVDGSNPASCQSCHGNKPHSVTMSKLNEHTDKIACQTCHIPEFARGQATKMSWDWSTAGQLTPEGKPITRKDSGGHNAYDSKKGDFTWEDHVIPEYIWFNGKVNYTLRDTKLDPTQVIKINSFEGSPDDGKSLIWPVKVFRGKQPYDTVSNTLLVPHTFGDDESSYWSNFDWGKSLEAGMKAANVPYSGKYDFVKTEMSWPITHMVAPKADALTCAQCHSKEGRLKNVKGIYMPGRGDQNKLLDTIGWSFALMTLIGVLLHGAIRIYAHKKGLGK